MADFRIPPTVTDTLGAVNVMLSAIGESRVNDLLEASEAADAITVLGEISEAVQTEGWPWNTDYGVELARDNSSRIPLPDNCIKVITAYPGNHSGSVVERGQGGRRFLYDNKRSSYVFDEPVLVDMLSKLDFEDMPASARRYITIRAAQQFQGRVQTSVAVDRITDPEVQRARATLEQEKDAAEPANAITGNVQTLGRTHGRGLRRRY